MLGIRWRPSNRRPAGAAAAAVLGAGLLGAGLLGAGAALAQADGGLKDPPPAPTQCPDNMDSYAGSDEALTCVCPEDAMARGSVWGTDTYTADSATCRAALHAGMAGRRGGLVSLRMLPGRPRYPGTTRNGVQSINYGSYAASFRFEGTPAAAPPPPPPTAAAAAAAPEQCPDNMDSFAGSDETLACACPPAQVGQGAVWGTDTYTADSATCRAAVHAGALSARGGPVVVEMLPGQARYPGTTRNGVQSNNYGAYAASFRVRGAGAPRPAAAATASTGAPGQCPDTLSAFEGSGETVVCVCPGELTLRGTVWGSGPYTADSATCRAAVHAGAIGVAGGTVSARMGPGEARYPGSTRNGVQSMNFGPYGAGFRFEGAQQRAKDAAPVQAPVAESLRSRGQVQLYVVFRTGSADLDIAAAPVLGEVRDALLADPSLRLRLVGHTDSTGSAALNRPLSVRRADAVRAWLAANGVAPDRLEAEGRGPDEPIADNATDAGRALNRRVQAAKLP